MFDINQIRTDPEKVKQNLQKRRDTEKIAWVDAVLKKDVEWKTLLREVEELRARRNVLSREIATQKKAGIDTSTILKEAATIPQKIAEKETRTNTLKEEIDNYLLTIPNMLHDSVPQGESDADNLEIKNWWPEGKTPEQQKKDFGGDELRSHVEIIESLQIGDFERSAKISGHGFYFLRGQLALLNQALIRFAVDHLVKKGYLYVEPPLMIRKKPYSGVVDMGAFEDVMYKVEGEDLYFIATSEHPLIAQFIDEIIEETTLPIKLVGYSMCFRKEVGSSGIDTKGLFRTHQFNKVEQIILCRAEDSWKLHEELQQNTEELFQKLKIPYRVVNVCTGDIGNIAAKKYDTEAWMPRQQKYREVGSNSNCTDYQARRLRVRSGKRGSGDYCFIHTLNNTAIATSRVLVALLENNQTPQGTVTIPEVLRPYLDGKTEIILDEKGF